MSVRKEMIEVFNINTPDKSSWPGYVVLERDEVRLPQKYVVDILQVTVIRKNEPGEYIGTLSRERVEQIFYGIQLLQNSC